MHEKREQTTISYDLSNWNSDLRRGRPISPQGSTVVVLFTGFITELTKVGSISAVSRVRS